jgi:hypothetical protein
VHAVAAGTVLVNQVHRGEPVEQSGRLDRHYIG